MSPRFVETDSNHPACGPNGNYPDFKSCLGIHNGSISGYTELKLWGQP